MSFSSTSTASSASSNSTSLSPLPNYKTLEALLLSLITLARTTYSSPSHSRIWSAATEYLRIHAKLNAFFTKYQDFDFVADETYGYCLEIKILLRLIECGLGTGHRDIEGLPELHGESMGEDARMLTRRVNGDVELLVFRGAELDVERLPWNLKRVGAQNEDSAGESD